MTETREGGCLCGAVRYVLETAPTHIDYCHCSMCRKFGGSMGVEVSGDAITWTGEDQIKTYQSSGWAERGFCGICGSSLFYRLTGPGADFLSLNAGTLDDANGLPLTTEIYIDDKPDGYAFAGETKKMTGAEVEAAFAAPPEGDGDTA